MSRVQNNDSQLCRNELYILLRVDRRKEKKDENKGKENFLHYFFVQVCYTFFFVYEFSSPSFSCCVRQC